MKNKFLLILLILYITGCGKKASKTYKETQIQKKSDIKQEDILDYIIFGVYANECGGDCFWACKLDVKQNKLYRDSYRNTELSLLKTIEFDKEIKDSLKVKAAKELIDSMPKTLINTNLKSERFGCPGCRDQGGFYIEFKRDTNVCKFTIDTETTKLTPEMAKYSKFLDKMYYYLRFNTRIDKK